MEIRRGHLYVVDFNPPIRTKPGKQRPALVLQSDLVNEAGYPSTIVIPTTTKLIQNPGLLSLHLPKGEAGLDRDSDLLLGQLIAVANDSFKRRIGVLPDRLMAEVERRVRIILAL